MPTNIVPNAIPSIVTTLPAPNDGEIANSASLTQFVTPLTDDSEAFRLLTYGGGMRRKVTVASNTSMSVYPLGAVVLQTGGVWKAYAHTVTSALNPTTMAGGVLAASTRYWVYAYDNAGALGFTVSVTAPDAGLRYMSGNTAYWYVSTFITSGASDILLYTQDDNNYELVPSVDTEVLTAGSAMAVTAITTTAVVPSQAVSFYYRATINTTVAGRYANFGDSGLYILNQDYLYDNGTGNSTLVSKFMRTAHTSYNGVFSYAVSDAATAWSVRILSCQL